MNNIKNTIKEKNISFIVISIAIIMFIGAYYWNEDSVFIFSIAVLGSGIFTMFMDIGIVKSWFKFFFRMVGSCGIIHSTDSNEWLAYINARILYNYIYNHFNCIYNFVFYL